MSELTFTVATTRVVGKRLVEAEAAPDVVDVLGRRVDGDQRARRIARDVDQGEREHADGEEDEEGLEQAPNEVSSHGAWSAAEATRPGPRAPAGR